MAASAAAALGLLWSTVRSGPMFWAGLAVTMTAGSASTLGALGSTLSGKQCWAATELKLTRVVSAGLRRASLQQGCAKASQHPAHLLYWVAASFKGRHGSHLLPLTTAVLLSAVEREWTKTLCGGNSEALAQLNAAMKRIDLTCLIASPILVGLVMQVRGHSPGNCNWPPALQHG